MSRLHKCTYWNISHNPCLLAITSVTFIIYVISLSVCVLSDEHNNATVDRMREREISVLYIGSPFYQQQTKDIDKTFFFFNVWQVEGR